LKNKQQSLILAIEESVSLKKKIILLEKDINLAINLIYKTLKNKKKIYICGNGGSAADAQNLSAEFLVRLSPKINRRPLPIISLALDTSTLTACANDYDFKYIFSRNLEALANSGDLLFCISTSGNSKNIIEVLKKSKKIKIKSLSLLGNSGGIAKTISDLSIVVPSRNTARIQEMHIFIGHYILEKVENLLFKKNFYKK
jgi:D-sedoheptulose 7-phosphate isomerase